MHTCSARSFFDARFLRFTRVTRGNASADGAGHQCPNRNRIPDRNANRSAGNANPSYDAGSNRYDGANAADHTFANAKNTKDVHELCGSDLV